MRELTFRAVVLDAVLAVLTMISQRKGLTEDEHGEQLPHPEGTARVEVLIVGAEGGAIVFVGASTGETTSQELKTGFLVGAMPRLHQLSLLVGVVTSALVIGVAGNMLDDASMMVAPRSHDDARVTVVTDARVTAPDGAALRVGFQRESGTTVPQGRDLVDDAVRPRFLVDPGIGGSATEDAAGRRTKVNALTAAPYVAGTRRLPSDAGTCGGGPDRAWRGAGDEEGRGAGVGSRAAAGQGASEPLATARAFLASKEVARVSTRPRRRVARRGRTPWNFDVAEPSCRCCGWCRSPWGSWHSRPRARRHSSRTPPGTRGPTRARSRCPSSSAR
jgi:hypothetical protein